MAIEKQIKTKISLRYLDYTTWSAESFKTEKPLKGEVWFCAVPQGNATATTAPTMLFKVGDGVNTFGDLKWCSALAADVYDWAKKPEADFITWVNTIVKHPAAPVITTGEANGTIAVDGKDVAVKGLGSAAYTETTAYATFEQGEKADSAVQSVALTGGTKNGTLKLTVDGEAVDNIAVTGLGNAAYTTIEALDATAKGYADAVEAKLPTSADYGVLEVKGDEASGIVVDKTDVQRPIVKIAANTYDAHGAAAAVLGTSADTASANTVYGAKAAAAAAQSDATIAKTKIETFLGTVTPDGSQDIIDTLAEINSYVGKHGEEFATLSGKVTDIENGTTVVPKATDADTLDGHDSTYFATAESVSDITKENGTIDSKISAYDAGKKFGDIITHNVAEFATSEQGGKADSALQEVEVGTGLTVSAKSDNKQTIEIDENVVFVLDCNW